MTKYIDIFKNRAQTSILQIYDIKTNKVEEFARFPFVIEAPNWSRDGKTLIYNSCGNIFIFDIATGHSKKLETGIANTCNNDHVLSFDGKFLAVSSGSDGDMMSRIYTVDFLTGEVQQIVSQPFSYLHGLSPDGMQFAYCAGRDITGNVEWDIYVKDSQEGQEIRLTNSEGLNDGPEYSPDGKKIWFNSVRTGRMQIWRMNPDGSGQEQMTFDESRNSWFPHVSLDGQHVVYISYHKEDLEPGQHLPDKHVEIRRISAVGGKEETLVKLFGGQGSMNVNSWSPDSQKFAFVSYSA